METPQQGQAITGRCECDGLQYRLAASPLFVHACHCLDCQRRTGSAFALSTILLEGDVRVTDGTLEARPISEMRMAHACSACGQRIYLTATNHPATALLNARTLDDLSRLNIGAHIWVRRKLAWLRLPDGVPQFDEAYDRDKTWPAGSLARLRKALAERSPNSAGEAKAT